MNAICSQLEVADDVILGANADEFGIMLVYICGLISLVLFEKVEISHLCDP